MLVVERLRVLFGREVAALRGPSRSTCRRGGRTPGGRRSRRRSALPWAARRGPSRRGRSARPRTGSASLPPSSGGGRRRPCGNTSAPGCRRRPGSNASGTIEAVEAEDDRAVGVLDLARRAAEFDGGVGRAAGSGEAPRDLHKCPPSGRVGHCRAPTRYKRARCCSSRRKLRRAAGTIPPLAEALSRLRLPPTRCLDWVDGPDTACAGPRSHSGCPSQDTHGDLGRAHSNCPIRGRTPKSLCVAGRTHTRCR